MQAVQAGFYGKLPARGDFVRFGLPRDFTDPWDAWLSAAIAGSRARMGEIWLPAFLESPVWCFRLVPGLCGTQAVLGLMLPSVDRAGRYFPLTFALLSPTAVDAPAWLDRCEAAGFAALENDVGPEQIAGMLGAPDTTADLPPCAAGKSVWWTAGGPRVPATRLTLGRLPDAAVFATMLDATMAETAAQDARMPSGREGPANMQASKAPPEGGESWEPPP